MGKETVYGGLFHFCRVRSDFAAEAFRAAGGGGVRVWFAPPG